MNLRYSIGQFVWLIGLMVSTVVVGPLLIIMSPLTPLRWRYGFVRLWPLFNLWTLQLLCGVRSEMIGQENIPDEPVIVFCKHQSTWETLMLVANFPPSVFVAKKELLWVPIFGWGMKSLRYITVNRGSRARAIESMCEQAIDRLHSRLNIIIFPEGTRRAVGAEPKYKIGGAVMAQRTGAKVLPMAHNAGLHWPRHWYKKYPGTITLSILPAIETEGLEPDAILDRVKSAIEAEQARLIGEQAQ